MKKIKQLRLSQKIMLGFALLGVLICVCTGVTGYFQYRDNLQRLYNTTAYDIAETAVSYFGEEELAEYAALTLGYDDGTVSEEEIASVRASDRYRTLSAQLDALRGAMDANDVFVFCLDLETLNAYAGDREGWEPLLYLFDSYTVPEYSYSLGDKSSFNPDYIAELATIGSTGERVDSLFISEGDYGYNTAAILPVTLADGSFVLFAVEIPMRTLQSALRGYLLGVVLIAAVIVVAIMIVYYFLFKKMFVRPVERMASAAADFVRGGEGGELSDSILSLTVHSSDELGLLCEALKQMERNIRDYIVNLQSVTAEKERIGAELNVATQIQASMLPCIFPAFPEREEFDVFASMTPAKEVGGDFYDFFMVDETHLAVVMADVSGKGVPAALFMVIGKTLIKDHTSPGRDLGDVFTEVNRLLCEANSEGLFITAFEGVLDLVTGELRYVNAGHEMPFIAHEGGAFAAYKIKPGFVLAGMEGMRYRAGAVVLEPGDKLFQYTDGVTEATDAEGGLYGMERLGKVLAENTSAPPEAVLAAVKADIDAFVKEAPQFDDITMLCLEYKKKMTEREERS